MPEKIIRDPVHDVIAFRTERPADALMFRLLNAAEFQRLRRIRQLGMASLAYPGADHSRYSHSLGVMETARQILDQLRRSFPIDEEADTVCVVATLLHDLVKLALQRAKRLAVQDRLPWPSRESVVYKALTGQRLSMAEFTELDDVSVNHCFKVWCGADDAALASLCRGLLFRKLYKTIDLSHLPEDQARATVKAAEQTIAAAGGDPRYEMFYDEPGNTPYQVYQRGGEGDGSEIMVIDPQGRLTPFGEVSPLTAALNRQLTFRRLHVSPQWKAAVEPVAVVANERRES